MPRTSKEIKNELKKLTDTVDIELTNQVIQMTGEGNFKNLKITKQTLANIAKWALDGKSQLEIAKNLELTKKEMELLCKICPAIVFVMERAQAYADIVIAGSLYQTAIGGNVIKKKMPMKVKDYDYNPNTGKSWVIGEHIEMVEYEEIQPPNPYLLKYLAENKLSENFGKVKADNSKQHREIIDVMSDEELKIIEKLDNADGK